MEILELHLKHFGKFTDYRLKLHSGVNSHGKIRIISRGA